MREMGEAAASWLVGRLGDMETALAALVEVNSWTENVEGGRKVGALLREHFAMPGLEAEVVPSTRYADHLVFRSEGRAGLEPVALVGHLDTVFPPGKFEGYRKDGALRRGPGVLDMKGGLVTIAWALKALAASGGLGKLPPLRLVVVSDEEVGSPEGAGVIQKAIAGAGACLVFESGRANDAIITRRKGTGMATAVAHGKAAHAGNNHPDGANALWALARFVDRVQQLTDYPRGLTVNVGKVTGGQGKNTVPDHATAEVDLRFCTRADGEELVRRFRQAADEAAASVPGTRIEVNGGVAREPLERTEASAALMAAYGTCAHASGLGHGEAALVGGGSDASTSSSMGIPSIDGLGPRGKGFHTVDEFIEVETLIPKAQALARYLASRAG
ncbi:M20 family metallopeptidase [Archangium sp.]|jgi:glutamate carboxypeptidase|uniref:M20 family metallopeptidase n=1 Tax=Archangium sp. TaxID=1872627 RepID=UPI003899ED46